MSYNITFYCETNGLAAAQALDLLLDRATSLGMDLWTGERYSGEGWSETDLDLATGDMREGQLRVEVQTSTELVAEMITQVADPSSLPALHNADAIIILTLSGSGENWAAVKVVWRVIASLWPAAPYDDVSGFAVSENSLG